MDSVFLREQKRYTQDDMREKLKCSEEKTVHILKHLKEYGVLKAVKENEKQRDLSELVEEDIEIADVEIGENEYLYVFTFVGVITIEGRVLKCYPKYLLSNNSPKNELKQVIKVLEKYNSKEQIIRMYNDTSDSTAFNMLAVMLYLLQDYYEYGSYTNSQDIIEENGMGEILWDKTINETFTFISSNRPYYPEILTRKRINNEFDYFKRLHECVLSKCSNELEEADLLDLFDILEVNLSDEELDDFGEKEYILKRIEQELNVQYNTRKQLLLKTIYAYINHSSRLDNMDCFSLFGTNNFNIVWEKVCAEVLDNQLQKLLGNIKLPTQLKADYNRKDTLISLIEKPIWRGKDEEGSYDKEASATLIPDLISIQNKNDSFDFVIFDAKYYNILLERDRPLRGQPGIESITKQYLYQLAYQKFMNDHNILKVRNCFLMPTEKKEVVDKGSVTLPMLHALGLADIQVRLVPAEKLYENYLSGKKMQIEYFNL